jgi:hypothetical protein
MAALADQRSELPVAAVKEIIELTVPALNHETGSMDRTEPPLRVVVTNVELIPDALEIHSWAGPQRYVLVKQFRTDPERPAAIIGVRGRHVSSSEAAIIEDTLTTVTVAARPYRVEIDEGDLVWSHGRAVVVALS